MQGYMPGFPPLKILGIVTFVVLLVAAGAAILYSRLRLKYETWKNIHRLSFVIFAMGFVHSFFFGLDLKYGWPPIRIFWLILAAIYVSALTYRIWNWARVRGNPFDLVGVSRETHDTWNLLFEGKKPNYKPGQFMIINLVRDGKVSESHPFTISSSPTRDRLSITAKEVGDFTSTIGETKTSHSAYIDAPYGVFSFLNHDVQHLVFIAGGIGITPFMSMLRYIYDSKLERNITLIWGNKTEDDIVFREELDKMAAEMTSWKIIHVMSKQENWQGEKGYVDAEKLEKYVDNLQDSEFFLCGPPVMMLSVEKELKNLGVSKNKIHYERFALR
jgi:predicted ferric reductase